jgi:hypothetical protein
MKRFCDLGADIRHGASSFVLNIVHMQFQLEDSAGRADSSAQFEEPV